MKEAGLGATVLTLAQITFHRRKRFPGHGGRKEVITEDEACEQDLQGQVGLGVGREEGVHPSQTLLLEQGHRRQEQFREMGRAAGFA